MSTAYSLSDTLPKDAGGAKFNGWVNANTSQLDFMLPLGIGASSVQSKMLGRLGIATHEQASKIEANGPYVAVGGVYIENPGASTVLSGRGNIAAISEYNELFTTGAPLAPSMLTGGSKDTVKTTSGIVFSLWVSGASVNKGDTITLQNMNNVVAQYVFGQGAAGNNGIYECGHIEIPRGGFRIGSGGLAGASITIARSIGAGAASATIVYR